jgi:cation diffusion facilitator CzcD-associated flavoprotein CzcO
VQVVTDPVDRVTANGVVAGGTEHPADTIIFGTGFASTGFLAPMQVTGRDGRDLHAEWRDGAEAHLGITVAGFPNLFVLYGPNTNLGHNSIVFMLERQIAYASTLIRRMIEDGWGAVEVRREAQDASNSRLRRRLDRTVWAASCHSWYKTASGKITNNWSGPTVAYWWRTRRPDLAEFATAPRSLGRPVHSGTGGSSE